MTVVGALLVALIVAHIVLCVVVVRRRRRFLRSPDHGERCYVEPRLNEDTCHDPRQLADDPR